jgi:GTP 3',8-cyclase
MSLLDNFGRIIDTLRISVTDQCNLKCIYCIPDMNNVINYKKYLTFEEITDVVKACSLLGINKIKLTGGEPLLRQNLSELIRMISIIRDISDISMTTNGILLSGLSESLSKAGLQRINISLDAIDPEIYYKITCGGNVNLVLDGIKSALDSGFKELKINTVLLKGINEDEIPVIMEFSKMNKLKFQLINRMDLTKDKSISENPEVTGRPPKCIDCSKLRLTSDGKLLPCLFSDIEIDLKNYKSIGDAIQECINSKPENGSKNTTRSMNRIGG